MLIASVRRFARWLLYLTEPQPSFSLLGLERYEPVYEFGQSVLVTPELDVRTAIHDAFLRSGLPADAITDDFDVVRTGKLHEVLAWTADELGKEHKLRTVKDIADYFATL